VAFHARLLVVIHYAPADMGSRKRGAPPLELREAKAFRSGVVALQYAPQDDRLMPAERSPR
jgi:hypothetical protein